MGFSRPEFCGGLPFPTPGDLPNPGIRPTSLAFPALASGFFTTVAPGKPPLKLESGLSMTCQDVTDRSFSFLVVYKITMCFIIEGAL